MTEHEQPGFHASPMCGHPFDDHDLTHGGCNVQGANGGRCRCTWTP